jgi:hypothetical protein
MKFSWLITFFFMSCLIVVPILLLLGLAFLGACLGEHESIVRGREAVERCVRLHGIREENIDEFL